MADHPNDPSAIFKAATAAAAGSAAHTQVVNDISTVLLQPEVEVDFEVGCPDEHYPIPVSSSTVISIKIAVYRC